MLRQNDREYWLKTMDKIANPVLTSLANQQLKQLMPVEGLDDRKNYSHLEAFARLISGMAPWIENGPRDGKEGLLRKHYAELIRTGIKEATDPSSPDYMNFSDGLQPIVDTAYFAQALMRAPNELIGKLDLNTKQNVIKAFKQTRTRKPVFNNWLLFAAMTETALYLLDEEDWDPMRIDFALKQHEQWYAGDGIYKDGIELHTDYYNSFVIHPMLVDITDHMWPLSADWLKLKENINKRSMRYAVILERSISPEGTYPVVGRSIVYRFGVFHSLAQMALQHKLDASLQPAQVRCALTAVIRKIVEMPGTFDDAGWLKIGLCGHQPNLGEGYISTGSLYMCAAVFLPLGLSPTDHFWQGEEEWTSKKAWSGQFISIDKAL
jgi:hypothetical protein